jgi:tetratricopeptide (TPR) repeat protein
MISIRPAMAALLLLTTAQAWCNGLPSAAVEIRDALQRNDLEAAIEAGEQATEASQDALVWLWAGRAYGRQAIEASLFTQPKWAGRTRDAWEKAVELDPDLLDARFDLIQYYLQAPGFLGGGRDKAQAQAAAIGQRDPALGKLAEGWLAMADKDPTQAEALQREAHALDPSSARIALALSGTLQRGEQWDAARELWLARLQRQPGDPLARYQLARLAAIRGENVEQGLALIEAFIAAGEIPENLSLGAAQWRRGQLLEKLGRLEEARAALRLGRADPAVKSLAEADLKRLSAKG